MKIRGKKVEVGYWLGTDLDSPSRGRLILDRFVPIRDLIKIEPSCLIEKRTK